MARSDRRRIVLFGASGQVGFELRQTLAPLGDLVCLDRAAVDLRDLDAVRQSVCAHRPDVIVNAAAFTEVDRAESEPELAFAVNAAAPRVIAEEAQASGACVVHYSTDYVFDGTKPLPYAESDATGPASVYGRSKLEGERAVAGACARHIVLRTSWVFGAHGRNFVKTMLRLGAARDALRVVADQHGAPTSAGLIAATTAALLRRAHSREIAEAWGLYHLAAGGSVSWADYARYILSRAGAAGFALKASADSVESISTSEYAAPAPRPLNSVLDTSKLRTLLGIDLPSWERDVDRVIQHLRTGAPA